MSLSGSTFDEIDFNVYKRVDNQNCSFWNDIIDLKIVDVVGYGQFEIFIVKDSDQNVMKQIHGISLETELTQIPIYDLHINDDDYFEYGIQDENNIDAYGSIKPIKLYNPSDKSHSLLHLLLSDKACHWNIGVVPKYISVTNNGKIEKELIESFQRTFTIDGQNIYDFLVNDLANEANLVYVFDTYNRRINIYDKFDIGEDTNVFINKRNLAEQITINDNADSVKNCFKVAGGDDIITNYLAAVNLTGNYIWGFGKFQYDDMPSGLSNAIRSYETYKNSLNEEYYGGYNVFNQIISAGKMSETTLKYIGNLNSLSNLPPAFGHIGEYYYINNTNKYYVSNGSSWEVCGAFTRLCSAYDYLSYLTDTKMPNVSLKTTNAQEQFATIEREFKNTQVAVSKKSIYSSTSFTGVTNNVIAFCKVVIDNRYTVESIEDITNNYPRYNGDTWIGQIRIYRTTDKNDTRTVTISVKINENELDFAKQKILKAVAKNNMVEVDHDVLTYTTSADYGKLVNYFQKYCLNRLKSFYDGYESCISILMSFQPLAKDTSAFNTIYTTYRLRRDAVYEVYQIREQEVVNQKKLVEQIENEKTSLQKQADFKSYLDKIDNSYWKLFNSYRREDTYQNDNYISEGLTDGQIIAKCKELLDYATYQLSMACQLQRTCSINLSNLLIMDEFKPFWDKFQIYNYIRIENDNEILKLRLIQIEVDFDDIEQITVAFSENISGNGNIANDIPDIIKQSSSMASTYNSIKQQSSQGNKAYNEVGKWIADGLLAAKTTISNSDNNEVTFGSYGINLKDMTEEGNYGDFQTRLIGQGLFYTQDGWKSVSLALGTIYIDGQRTSGVIAENVIGKLLAGNTLYITNEKGSFLLNGDTAKFTDITIDYQDKNGNRVKIGGTSDRIFSISHNGNEVLYFNNVSNKMVLTGTLEGCDGNFSGSLSACNISGSTISGNTIHGNTITGNTISGGTISGTNISGSTITGNSINGGTISGTTISGGSIIGSSINVNDKFIVNPDGSMKATSAEITGKIIATSGTFTGDIYANNGYFKGDITGATGTFSGLVSGGSINIANNFIVDKNGNLSSNTMDGMKNNLISSINQTAENIRAEVRNTTDNLWSAVNQTASEISQKVSNSEYESFKSQTASEISQKVSKGNVVSEINQSYDTISLTSGRLLITSGNFLLDSSGNITCNSGEIGGFTITRDGLSADGGNGTRIWHNIVYTGELRPYNNFLTFIIGNYPNNLELVGSSVKINGSMYMAKTAMVTSNSNISINSDGLIGKTVGSSEKWKHDICKIKDPSIHPHKLYHARTYEFIYNGDYLDKNDYRYGKKIPGFIVERLKEDYPIAVDCNFNGEPADWSPRMLIAPMLCLIQEQHNDIEKLKLKVVSINNKYSNIKKRIRRLEEILLARNK